MAAVAPTTSTNIKLAGSNPTIQTRSTKLFCVIDSHGEQLSTPAQLTVQHGPAIIATLAELGDGLGVGVQVGRPGVPSYMSVQTGAVQNDAYNEHMRIGSTGVDVDTLRVKGDARVSGVLVAAAYRNLVDNIADLKTSPPPAELSLIPPSAGLLSSVYATLSNQIFMLSNNAGTGGTGGGTDDSNASTYDTSTGNVVDLGPATATRLVILNGGSISCTSYCNLVDTDFLSRPSTSLPPSAHALSYAYHTLCNMVIARTAGVDGGGGGVGGTTLTVGEWLTSVPDAAPRLKFGGFGGATWFGAGINDAENRAFMWSLTSPDGESTEIMRVYQDGTLHPAGGYCNLPVAGEGTPGIVRTLTSDLSATASNAAVSAAAASALLAMVATASNRVYQLAEAAVSNVFGWVPWMDVPGGMQFASNIGVHTPPEGAAVITIRAPGPGTACLALSDASAGVGGRLTMHVGPAGALGLGAPPVAGTLDLGVGGTLRASAFCNLEQSFSNALAEAVPPSGAALARAHTELSNAASGALIVAEHAAVAAASAAEAVPPAFWASNVVARAMPVVFYASNVATDAFAAAVFSSNVAGGPATSAAIHGSNLAEHLAATVWPAVPDTRASALWSSNTVAPAAFWGSNAGAFASNLSPALLATSASAGYTSNVVASKARFASNLAPVLAATSNHAFAPQSLAVSGPLSLLTGALHMSNAAGTSASVTLSGGGNTGAVVITAPDGGAGVMVSSPLSLINAWGAPAVLQSSNGVLGVSSGAIRVVGGVVAGAEASAPALDIAGGVLAVRAGGTSAEAAALSVNPGCGVVSTHVLRANPARGPLPPPLPGGSNSAVIGGLPFSFYASSQLGVDFAPGRVNTGLGHGWCAAAGTYNGDGTYSGPAFTRVNEDCLGHCLIHGEWMQANLPFAIKPTALRIFGSIDKWASVDGFALVGAADADGSGGWDVLVSRNSGQLAALSSEYPGTRYDTQTQKYYASFRLIVTRGARWADSGLVSCAVHVGVMQLEVPGEEAPVVVNAAGCVGVGTASPACSLDVRGAVAVTGGELRVGGHVDADGSVALANTAPGVLRMAGRLSCVRALQTGGTWFTAEGVPPGLAGDVPPRTNLPFVRFDGDMPRGCWLGDGVSTPSNAIGRWVAPEAGVYSVAARIALVIPPRQRPFGYMAAIVLQVTPPPDLDHDLDYDADDDTTLCDVAHTHPGPSDSAEEASAALGWTGRLQAGDSIAVRYLTAAGSGSVALSTAPSRCGLCVTRVN